MKVILIDNGHGYDTPGKCSPTKDDGTKYREYKWARQAAKILLEKIKKHGDILGIQVVTEENDISLTTRALRANRYISKFGADNCVFVSIHSNAAPGTGWSDAQGWSIWTTKGQNNSDKLATCIYNEAKRLLENDKEYVIKNPKQKKVRGNFTDGDGDFEANFTVIKKTNCPAVLIENLFHNNKTDVEYLESNHGKDVLTDIILNGCLKYFEEKDSK